MGSKLLMGAGRLALAEAAQGWSLVGESTFVAEPVTTPDINLPGPPAEGDVVLVVIASDSTIFESNEGIAAAEGYTDIAKPNTAFPGHQIAYKRMGPTPDAVVAVQGDSANPYCGLIQVWRGADATTQIDATATSDTGTASTLTPPSYTTVTNGALRIIIGCLDDDASADVTTPPSGWTDFLAADTTAAVAANNATVMIASKEAPTAGEESPGGFVSTADDWFTYHFALRPAA